MMDSLLFPEGCQFFLETVMPSNTGSALSAMYPQRELWAPPVRTRNVQQFTSQIPAENDDEPHTALGSGSAAMNTIGVASALVFCAD